MSDGPVAIETVFRAARAGDLSQLKKILAHLPVDCRDNRGETPLMVCADEGNLTCVEWLLSAGADVNAADYEGETALIHAVQCLDGPVEEMVSLLLRHGANINAVSTMGHSPLIQALAWRNRRAVVALLSYGPDLEIATPDSETATTYAIARWDVEMVRMLLDAGANPNWTTADGGTLLGEALCPLNRRADYSERQIVRLLLEHGADPDQVDVDRGTPLMMAVRTDDPVLLATILAWTKNVNCRDEKEKTALTIARERGMTEIIALLRQAGAIE